jgi:hypothetical protein
VVLVKLSFNPTPGQVALVERQDRGHPLPAPAHPLTGVVGTGSDELLTLIGLSSPDLADGTEVVVSIFAPEALYRIRATAYWGLSGRLAIDPIHHVERVQRRRWPRHMINLDATLVPLDGPDYGVTGIHGHTLDLGMGGLRVETSRRLPRGADMTVILTLPDGARLLARTTVVAADIREGVFEYRLAFDQLDDDDAAHLTALVGSDPASTTDG